MDQQSPAKPAGKPKLDSKAKIALLGAVVLVGALIYWKQTSDPKLPGWDTDLSAALAQAKAQHADVLVLFTNTPMDYEDQHIVRDALTTDTFKEKVKTPCVHLSLKNDSDLAKKYGVTQGATLVLLDADGNRLKPPHAGFIRDLDIANVFMSEGGPGGGPSSPARTPP